jgi:hypothetical protein
VRIKKPYRGETITVTVTPEEKTAIAENAEKEKRTMSGYIRYKLRDVLEGVNNPAQEVKQNGEL